MLNGGADLRDVPARTLYDIAYAEQYRQVELSMGEEHEKAIVKIDRSIRELEPDDATGLPVWVAETMPSADGSVGSPLEG